MKWCSLGHEINFSFFFRIFRQSQSTGSEVKWRKGKGRERRLSHFFFDVVISKVEGILQQIMKLNSIFLQTFPFISRSFCMIIFHICQLKKDSTLTFCEYSSHFVIFLHVQFNFELQKEQRACWALWVLIFSKTFFFLVFSYIFLCY